VPEGQKNSKGRAIQNLISISPDDKVKAFINIKNLNDEEYIKNNFIILCTKDGIIKKTSIEAYSRPRSNGINAITIREGDVLLEAALTNGSNEIMLATKLGKVCRFNESKVRPMGRNASGVIGIDLNDEVGGNNEVIGMICIADMQANVLVVSEKGYGKRSDIDEYRITNRGGKGVKTINVTEKTGNLVAIKSVTNSNDLMIITKNGIAIRMNVADLRVMGRATQGVKLINIQDLMNKNENIKSENEMIENEKTTLNSIIDNDLNINTKIKTPLKYKKMTIDELENEFEKCNNINDKIIIYKAIDIYYKNIEEELFEME
jgi:DNA gyrase subunit A